MGQIVLSVAILVGFFSIGALLIDSKSQALPCRTWQASDRQAHSGDAHCWSGFPDCRPHDPGPMVSLSSLMHARRTAVPGSLMV
jgi:hypothetical protein